MRIRLHLLVISLLLMGSCLFALLGGSILAALFILVVSLLAYTLFMLGGSSEQKPAESTWTLLTRVLYYLVGSALLLLGAVMTAVGCWIFLEIISRNANEWAGFYLVMTLPGVPIAYTGIRVLIAARRIGTQPTDW